MITLVLLPGMDGTGELFAPFIAALDGAFEVVVVRYPGDRALGYEALEGIAREALPKDGPFVLLGESFRLLGHLVLGRDSTASLRAVLGVDVSAKLETVSVPVLCLRAFRDRVVPRSAGALVMCLAPRSQHVEIDASHFLLQGAPNDAARVVRQFASEGRRAQSTG